MNRLPNPSFRPAPPPAIPAEAAHERGLWAAIKRIGFWRMMLLLAIGYAIAGQNGEYDGIETLGLILWLGGGGYALSHPDFGHKVAPYLARCGWERLIFLIGAGLLCIFVSQFIGRDVALDTRGGAILALVLSFGIGAIVTKYKPDLTEQLTPKSKFNQVVLTLFGVGWLLALMPGNDERAIAGMAVYSAFVLPSMVLLPQLWKGLRNLKVEPPK